MTVPLVILAVFSVIAGFVGLPAVLGEKADLFRLFLEPVLGTEGAVFSAAVEWNLILVSTVAAVAGFFIAYLFYLRYPSSPSRLAGRVPWLYRLLVGKYYVDEIYDAAIVRPVVRGSELIYNYFDLTVIDGVLNGSAAAANAAAGGFSRLQTGLIKDYALSFLLAVVIFMGVILFLKV
jgi:NADH-quinone oxidoreductase subunit L